MSVTVQVNSDNQVEIPSDIIEELHLDPGDQLLAHVRDGVIVLVPRRGDAVDQLRGLYRDVWKGEDAQTYVNQERDAWETS